MRLSWLMKRVPTGRIIDLGQHNPAPESDTSIDQVATSSSAKEVLSSEITDDREDFEGTDSSLDNVHLDDSVGDGDDAASESSFEELNASPPIEEEPTTEVNEAWDTVEDPSFDQAIDSLGQEAALPIKQTVTDLVQKRLRLERTITEKERENVQLRADLQELHGRMIDQKKDVLETLWRSQTQLEQKKKLVSKLKDYLLEFEIVVSNQQGEINAWTEKRDELVTHVRFLVQEHDAVVKNMTASIEDLKEQLYLRNAAYVQLQDCLQLTKQEAASAVIESKEMTIKLQELEDLKVKNEELLEIEINKHQATNTHLRNTLKKVEALSLTIASQYQEHTRTVEMQGVLAREAQATMKERITQLQVETRTDRERVETLIAEKAALEAKHAEKCAEAAKADSAHNEMHDLVVQTRDRLAELQAEKDALCKQLANKSPEEAEGSMTEQKETARQRLGPLQEPIDDIRNKKSESPPGGQERMWLLLDTLRLQRVKLEKSAAELERSTALVQSQGAEIRAHEEELTKRMETIHQQEAALNRQVEELARKDAIINTQNTALESKPVVQDSPIPTQLSDRQLREWDIAELKASCIHLRKETLKVARWFALNCEPESPELPNPALLGAYCAELQMQRQQAAPKTTEAREVQHSLVLAAVASQLFYSVLTVFQQEVRILLGPTTDFGVKPMHGVPKSSIYAIYGKIDLKANDAAMEAVVQFGSRFADEYRRVLGDPRADQLWVTKKGWDWGEWEESKKSYEQFYYFVVEIFRSFVLTLMNGAPLGVSFEGLEKMSTPIQALRDVTSGKIESKLVFPALKVHVNEADILGETVLEACRLEKTGAGQDSSHKFVGLD